MAVRESHESIPLKDLLLALLAEKDKRDEQRFEAMKEAITKAETATNIRLAGMNEFRDQLKDQAKDFLPRQEYYLARETNLDRFGKIESRLDTLAGRSGGLQHSWVIIIGAVTIAGILFGIAGFILAHSGVGP